MRQLLATALDAPWGPVHLAASEDGLVAVELMTTAEAFAEGLLARRGLAIEWLADHRPLPTAAGRHLLAARAALVAAFGGAPDARARLDALVLDLADRPAWDRAVLGAVRGLAPGEVLSYGGVARRVGKPGAARAVGGAVGRNPIGFVIPCHRVIAGDGTLGGYGGGWWGDRERLLELKEELLAREGVRVPRSRPRPDRDR